jgi:hypothetical protein
VVHADVSLGRLEDVPGFGLKVVVTTTGIDGFLVHRCTHIQ